MVDEGEQDEGAPSDKPPSTLPLGSVRQAADADLIIAIKDNGVSIVKCRHETRITAIDLRSDGELVIALRYDR